MLNKEIKIRPIGLNGFLSSIRKGFSFDTDIMLPSFSQFEVNCIKTDRKQLKRNSKKNVFWVPDFCYCGTVIATKNELSLKSLLPENRNEKTACDEFNQYFLEDVPKDKKYYYYKRLSSPNMPAYYFSAGVRLIASIINQWRKYNEVNEFFLAQKLLEFINASGLFEIIGSMPKKIFNSDNETNHFNFKYNELHDDFIVSLALNKNEVVVVDTMVRSQSKSSTPHRSPSIIATSRDSKESHKTTLGHNNAVRGAANAVLVEKTASAGLSPAEPQKPITRDSQQVNEHIQRVPSIVSTDNGKRENNTAVNANHNPDLVQLPSREALRQNEGNDETQGFIQTIAPKAEQPLVQRRSIIKTDNPVLEKSLFNDDKKDSAAKTDKPAITTRSGFIIGDY